MKKLTLLILLTGFLLLSCEQNDMYTDGVSYSSIYAWFRPEDSKINSSSYIYNCDEKDGRGHYLYYDTATGPTLDPGTFNFRKSISFGGAENLRSDSFQLAAPMTIIFAVSNWTSAASIIGNASSTSSLLIRYTGSAININDPYDLSVPVTNLSTVSVVITVRINSDNVAEVYINNSFAGKAALSLEPSINGLLLGTDGIYYSQVLLGDIIFFNRAINDKAREYYVNLLKDKYGI